MKSAPTPKVLVVTWVHNGEKTLSMTIDSILNQTHDNFVYYIVDNASTDKTAEIIKSYADRDSRIKYLPREVNSCDLILYNWVIKSIDEEYDYLTNIDGDDEYKPDFLEKTLAFARAHDLDIVCGGYDVVNSLTKDIIEKRVLPENMLLTTGSSFSDNFSTYYFNHARQIHGKLYRKTIIDALDLAFHPHNDLAHGADTIFCLNAYQNAKRVGIIAEAFYIYYMYPSSLSNRLSSKRIESGDILYDEIYSFMENKFDEISVANKYSLYCIHLQNTADTVEVIIRMNADVNVKLDYLHCLFTNERTRQVIGQVNMVDKNNFMWKTSKWVQSQSPNGDTNDKLQMLSNLLSEIDRAISTPPSLAHVCNNACDDKFFTLLSALMSRTEEHSTIAAIQNIKALKATDPGHYAALIEWHKKSYGLNDLQLESGFNSYCGEIYKYLKSNVEQMYTAYQTSPPDGNGRFELAKSLSNSLFYWQDDFPKQNP